MIEHTLYNSLKAIIIYGHQQKCINSLGLSVQVSPLLYVISRPDYTLSLYCSSGLHSKERKGKLAAFLYSGAW